jgi:formate dehydrogenase maturation protein FdhE
MKMSFACEVDHEPEHTMLGHTVRVDLERGHCPVCPGSALAGAAAGGLEWAVCPCCGSRWRLDTDGFALRPGRIVEEWS